MIEEKDIGTPRLTDFIAKSVTDLNDDHRLGLLAIHASEDSKRILENAFASENFDDVGLEDSEFRADPIQQCIVLTPSDRWTFAARWKYASGRPTDAFVVHGDVLSDAGPVCYSKELTRTNAERLPTIGLSFEYSWTSGE